MVCPELLGEDRLPRQVGAGCFSGKNDTKIRCPAEHLAQHPGSIVSSGWDWFYGGFGIDAKVPKHPGMT